MLIVLGKERKFYALETIFSNLHINMFAVKRDYLETRVLRCALSFFVKLDD